MKTSIHRKALNGLDLFAVEPGHFLQTGVYRFPVDHDRTGATMTLAAAIFRPC